MTSFIKPERRPLTQEERNLLEWLIANGSVDAKEYSPQLADLTVVGTCTCGCPTIDLALGGCNPARVNYFETGAHEI